MPTGGGSSAGPFHSQSNEAWFVHTPGLKVVYPAFPADAKGLLCAAIEDPNPVMFFEHKALYRSIKEDVPDDYYTVEIGKAHLVRQGSQVTIIAYGYSVHWALEILDKHPEVSATLIDLRTLVPLDYESIRQSVMSTGRVLIVHEDTLVGGIGGEIAAWIGQELFTHLDAPVMRCASLDTPVPFATKLEQNFFAKSRLEQTLLELMAY
jgi:2-oxoisovalerate dehydrogenase E1 component